MLRGQGGRVLGDCEAELNVEDIGSQGNHGVTEGLGQGRAGEERGEGRKQAEGKRECHQW